MSGGRWYYIQYRFTDISDDIERLIERNGKPKTEEEIKNEWHDSEWYEKYPEDKFHTKYSEETIRQFIHGLEYIKKAQIYIQRFDYLLSGDDGEESFLRRVSEDLKKHEEERTYQI